MSERRGTKALETWCRRLTEGYPGVKVENMTTSWRDGLAFCAIIHHFRPDLIDFASLSPSNIYYNNSMAFSVAERQLGIPALLDAEDMVMYTVPDRLSILTYLSQFYQVFGNQGGVSAGAKQGTSQRIVPKRPAIAADRGMMSPASSSPPTKMASRSSIGVTGVPSTGLGRREPCAKCGFPVFLAERLNVGSKLYHRTCFRCARCNNQLSLANCYETETDGQYCCETCPDEEEEPNKKISKFDSLDNVDKSMSEKLVGNQNLSQDTDSIKLNRLDEVKNRSLSDEEKSKGLLQFEDDDEYSAHFEHALEEPKIYQDDRVSSKARNHFLSTHLLNEDVEDAVVPKILIEDNTENDIPPPLPDSKPPDISSTAVEDTLIEPEDISSEAVEEKPNIFASNKNIFEDKSIADTLIEATAQSKDISSKEIEEIPNQLFTTEATETLVKPSSSQIVINEDLTTANEDKCNISSSILENEDPCVLKTATENLVSSPSSQIVFNEDLKPEANASTEEISSTGSLTTEEQSPARKSTISSEESHSTGNVNNEISPESEEIEDSSVHISNSSQQKTASDAMFEDPILREKKTKDTNRSSLVQSRRLLFELGSKEETKKINSKVVISKYFKKDEERVPLEDVKDSIDEEMRVSEKTRYLSTSSKFEENEEEKYDTINNSDNIVLYHSTISEDSPLEDTKEESNISNEDNVLSKSIIENLSDDQTAVSINSSLLEDSKNEAQYPEDLNPFGDDEEPTKNEDKVLIRPSMEDLTIITPTKEERGNSTNPFGSSDEDEPAVLKQKPPRPPLPPRTEGTKRVLEAPRVSLNPFWSDDEEPIEENSVKPVPMPRSKHLNTPEPKPRRSGLSNTASHYDSNSSLSSMSSSFGHTPGKKKKPAPPPPTGTSLTPESSKQSSPSTSTHPSPKLTPKVRKNRKAPLPPSSTPFVTSNPVGENLNVSPIERPDLNDSKTPDSLVLSPDVSDVEKEKKDEKNRNRQSQNISSPTLSDSESLSISQQSSTDKSTHGKWKRKKGPAPARPVPQRRQIRPLPLMELRRELDIIEMQQQGLEKQGVKLEQLIREKCEFPGSNDETALSPEVEDLVLELFELVNEKNELFRKQAELMYLRRQQRLEEEHADLEYQIRCLMDRPERNKTDSDKAREEELISRLLEVVERRNEIVECLEMDRVREAEEDQSINFHLNQLASKKEEELSESPVKLSKKEKKKMKKEKKLKEMGKILDADKDIDESEPSAQVVKDKKKKKWF